MEHEMIGPLESERKIESPEDAKNRVNRDA